MQNETPLTDISSLLSSIHSDLITQQQEATKLQRKREAECDESIKEFNRRIDSATTNIGQTIKRIGNFRTKISSLKTSINTFQNQMVVVNDHLKLVKRDRKADANAYVNRVRNTEQTIEALDMILPKLAAIGSQSTAEVLVQLSKIGKSNPIAAFMQVASSIDKNKLGTVVEKMQELRDSLQASLEEDATQESNSGKSFKKLVSDLEKTYAGLGRSLAAARSNLAQAKTSLKNEERYLVEQKEEKKSAQEGLAAKEKQCDNWAKTFAQQTESRYSHPLPLFNLSKDPPKDKLSNKSNKSLL
jgi:chromosome segregation ATPase